MMRKPRVASLGADLSRGLFRLVITSTAKGRCQANTANQYSQRRIAAPQRPAPLPGQAAAPPAADGQSSRGGGSRAAMRDPRLPRCES